MSFPPPPQRKFAAPPPPAGGSRFPAPPAPPGGGATTSSSFPAPPPPAAAANGGVGHMTSQMGNLSMQQQQAKSSFPAPPPPPGQQQQSAPSFSAPKPPGGAGMFRPPPPGAPKPSGAGHSFPSPPPPGGSGPGGVKPPAMFSPPPPPGGGGAIPAPPGGPAVFTPTPPPPGASHPPGMMPPGPGGPGGPLQGGQTHSAFYAQQPNSAQMNRMVGGGAPPVAPGGPMPPGTVPGAQPGAVVVNENIDYSITIPDKFFRFTAKKLLQTAAQASSSKIPFGGVLRPMAPPESAELAEEEVPTVQPGTAGIVRCKRCRTYINAFVSWSDHGRRWRCNICAQINDCPSAYFCHLDDQGLRRDRYERPELSRGVVEFVAPAEYMVRPPQEPTYFFVIDVSATAVRSGMVESAANAIKASLDHLPGRGRTKIGFITFDNSVHYYNLASDLSNAQMLVVSDLRELFVPLPDNLLVNLQESRAVVNSFLDSLPEMFVKHPVHGQSCLGPALKAAFTVMKQIGGKMCVFQSIMPNLGDGALKPREAPAIMGTPNEIKLLRPEVTWYKETAVEFSRQQISVDMFLFPYQYMDLASLGELPKYTAGTMNSYVMFNKRRDGKRFETTLIKTLTQTTAFEAVMRIRCTKGMRITNFYGNFYIRGSDLLALPNCNTDSVFGFDLVHDEQNLTATHVTVQAALLYTSADGERRIRVMTQALPVSTFMSEVVASVDTESCCALLAKQALEVSVKSSLDQARMRLQQVCVEIVRAAKGGDKRTVSGYSVPPGGGPPGGPAAGGMDGGEEKALPDNLQLLPLYTLAMMKNVAFRGGTDVHPDERIQAHHWLTNMWVPKSKIYIYPRLYSIHDMDAAVGLPKEENVGGDDDDDPNASLTAGRNNILLPQANNLSIERLSSDGVYLLDNGVEMYLWVGREANLNVISALFGVLSFDDLDPQQIEVNMTGDALATRFGNIVDALREDIGEVSSATPKINIVREGDQHMEARFYWFLIEDRASFQGGTHSYDEFMHFVQNPQASAGVHPPGGGPRGPPGAPVPPSPQPGMGMGAPPPQGGGGFRGPPGPPGAPLPPQQQPGGGGYGPPGGQPPSPQYPQPNRMPPSIAQRPGPPGGGMMPPPPGRAVPAGPPGMGGGGPPPPPQQQSYAPPPSRPGGMMPPPPRGMAPPPPPGR